MTSANKKFFYEAETSTGQKLFIKKQSLITVGEDGGVYINQDTFCEAAAFQRLRDCNSPNIVHLYRTVVDPENLTVEFQMRLMDRFPDHLPNYADKVRYIRDIFEGLWGMHKAGVLHRDVKLDNIMLDPITGQACFIDFGLSVLDEERYASLPGTYYTLQFRPPEILMSCKNYENQKCEVWAAGVCAAIILLDDQSIFYGVDSVDVLSRILGCTRVPNALVNAPFWQSFYDKWDGPKYEEQSLWDRITDPLARDFVMKCLDFNSVTRPTIWQMLNHDFIKGMDLGRRPLQTPIPPNLSFDNISRCLSHCPPATRPMLYKMHCILENDPAKSYPKLYVVSLLVYVFAGHIFRLDTVHDPKAIMMKPILASVFSDVNTIRVLSRIYV